MTFPVAAPFKPDNPDMLKKAKRGGVLRLEDGQAVGYVAGQRMGVVESEEVRQHLAAGGRAGFHTSDTFHGVHAICSLE